MNKTREKFITNRITFAAKEKAHAIYNRLFILFLGGFFLSIIVCGSFLIQTFGEDNKLKNYTCQIPGTSIKFDMIYIPGGEFDMGSPDDEPGRNPDEGPVHRVNVSPFWIGKTVVTWDEYECYAFKLDVDPNSKKITVVTRPSPSWEPYDHSWGREKNPAMGLSWYAAKKYCEWLSVKTGENYRLPTEAEWEFACRSGSSTMYPFGNDSEKIKDYAWFNKNSGGKTNLVGLKQPNAFGLYDMLGNVLEYCSDFYDPDYYKTFKDQKVSDNPQGPEDGLDAVIRGGCWNDPPSKLRCASRMELPFEWNERDPQRPRSEWWLIDGQYVGFRVVRSDKNE